MKKISDNIKLLRTYKKTKKDLEKNITWGFFDCVLRIIIGLICFLGFTAVNYINFWLGIIWFLNAVLALGEIIDNKKELKQLNIDYERALDSIDEFVRKLKTKGIKISKDSLVKSNVYSNKTLSDMTIISAKTKDLKEEIKIIEEPKSNSLLLNHGGYSMVNNLEDKSDMAYFVDSDLVKQEKQAKDTDNELGGSVKTIKRNI